MFEAADWCRQRIAQQHGDVNHLYKEVSLQLRCRFCCWQRRRDPTTTLTDLLIQSLLFRESGKSWVKQTRLDGPALPEQCLVQNPRFCRKNMTLISHFPWP